MDDERQVVADRTSEEIVSIQSGRVDALREPANCQSLASSLCSTTTTTTTKRRLSREEDFWVATTTAATGDLLPELDSMPEVRPRCCLEGSLNYWEELSAKGVNRCIFLPFFVNRPLFDSWFLSSFLFNHRDVL